MVVGVDRGDNHSLNLLLIEHQAEVVRGIKRGLRLAESFERLLVKVAADFVDVADRHLRYCIPYQCHIIICKPINQLTTAAPGRFTIPFKNIRPREPRPTMATRPGFNSGAMVAGGRSKKEESRKKGVMMRCCGDQTGDPPGTRAARGNISARPNMEPSKRQSLFFKP